MFQKNITYVFIFLALCAISFPAAAQQYNTNDGTNYLTSDSAFQMQWNPTSDSVVMRAAPVGTADAAISWTDAIEFTSDANVSFPQGVVIGNATTCDGDVEGRIRYVSGSTPPWQYCDGSSWTDISGGGGGSGWTADCDDYSSTTGLENLVSSVSSTVFTSAERVVLDLSGPSSIGTSDLAGDPTVMTACVTGDGSPALSVGEFEPATTITDTQVPVISRISFPYVIVTAPTTLSTSNTGTVTFGTAVSIPYTLTYSTRGNLAFVTSTSHQGDFGGLSGADAICAARATAAGLSGTFKAVLSTDTVAASSRFSSISYPVVDPNDNIVANTNFFSTEINVSTEEDGSSGSNQVWTGSNDDGSIGSTNCDNWTTNGSSPRGIRGIINGSFGLFQQDNFNCSFSIRILCLED